MENYEVIEHLNNGSFGKVEKIRRKNDGKVLVWKELDYTNMNDKQKHQLVNEVNILRELRHPNIVRYYDRIIDKPNHKIWIIQEYCEGGDVAQLIKKCKKDKVYLPEEQIWRFFMQVILALHEIHQRKSGKILHRDIKPANIFLDVNNNAKLGDFGLSKVLTDENQFAETSVGTPYYMSPEQITDKKYNEKSDIWACGCLLFELCNLSPPFEATNHLQLALKIKGGKIDRIPSQYSNELWRVIQWILSRNTADRPTVDELLNIPEISMRLREKRLREAKGVLKKKEEDLKAKLEALEARAKGIQNRESELEYKEKKLMEEEKRLKELEIKHKTALINSSFTRDKLIFDQENIRSRGNSISMLKNLTTLSDLSLEKKYSSNDRTLNNTSLDNYSYSELPKLSRMNSKAEESVSETYLTYEINNILKNLDMIGGKNVGDIDSSIRTDFDESPSIGFTQNSLKTLQFFKYSL